MTSPSQQANSLGADEQDESCSDSSISSGRSSPSTNGSEHSELNIGQGQLEARQRRDRTSSCAADLGEPPIKRRKQQNPKRSNDELVPEPHNGFAGK